ncbi:MAG: DUF3311 domain-containing protein [Acidobacteriaceae bacterium]
MSHSLSSEKRTRRRNLWALLLILPYAGLLFPQMYNRAEPSLWGFPFFYWYQFAWVILSSLITGFVYLKSKPIESDS